MKTVEISDELYSALKRELIDVESELWEVIRRVQEE